MPKRLFFQNCFLYVGDIISWISWCLDNNTLRSHDDLIRETIQAQPDAGKDDINFYVDIKARGGNTILGILGTALSLLYCYLFLKSNIA